MFNYTCSNKSSTGAAVWTGLWLSHERILEQDFLLISGIKQQVIDMILSYNTLWLRIGLEVSKLSFVMEN